MSTRQILGVVGAAIGGYFFGPTGAQWGWAIGSAVGGAVDPEIIKGPSVGDLAAQTSQEGTPRPIVFACSQPMAGNIIATGEPRIVKKKSSAGKGGPKVETESVYRTYAIGVCEGPIGGFVRVWRNGQLVYDAENEEMGGNIDLEFFGNPVALPGANGQFLQKARFFLGTFDQEPSPDLETIFGLGTTPAHRGTAYMVIADEDLTDMRGAIPQYQFQVTQAALQCEVVTDYSNEVMTPWPGGTEMLDPRAPCASYEYRWDLGGALGYNPPNAGDAGSLSAAVLNSPNPINSDLLGWNLRNDTPQGIFPYNSTMTALPNDRSRWFFYNTIAPTGISNALWNSFVDPFFAFVAANNLEGKWWSGNNAAAPSAHGVILAGGTNADYSVEVRLVPSAPSTQCDACGDNFVVSQFPGYCTDGEGNYFSILQPWTRDESENWLVLQEIVFVGNSYAKFPLSPARPESHPEYSDQAFWEAAYTDAVAAGDMPAGLVYPADYPKTQDFGYLREYQSCTFGDGVISLRDLITAICARAGLQAALIDVSAIPAETFCRGFTVINSYPATEALRALSQIFLFDPAPYDGKVHFIPRGGTSVATVVEANMVDNEEDIDQTRRSDAISIPRVLHLNYYDMEGGLATNKQSSERSGDRRATGESSLQTAVLMNAEEAARVIAINHKIMIGDQGGELRFCLPDSLLRLVPTNPMVVQWQGRSERARIVKIEVQEGYQSYVLLRDRQSNYTATVEPIPVVPPSTPPSSQVGPTVIVPLDIHILRDADDNEGLSYYVAVSGLLPAWQGALVELSFDGGENYVNSASTTTAAVIGELVSTLADHPQEFLDEISTLNVRIHTPLAELETTDFVGMLNHENRAIIGDEIMQFRDANEITSGIWQLSYLLRGRKGTQTTSHAIGERFVLLAPSTMELVPAAVTDIGRTLTFRATSFGSSPDDGTVVSMIYSGRSQIEREPAYLTAHMDGANAVVAWQGVGRLGSGASVAQGARFAGYRVTFDDGVIQEVVDTADQDLTHDVSALATPFYIRVSQLNDLTGAGPSIEVIIS